VKHFKEKGGRIFLCGKIFGLFYLQVFLKYRFIICLIDPFLNQIFHISGFSEGGK